MGKWQAPHSLHRLLRCQSGAIVYTSGDQCGADRQIPRTAPSPPSLHTEYSLCPLLNSGTRGAPVAMMNREVISVQKSFALESLNSKWHWSYWSCASSVVFKHFRCPTISAEALWVTTGARAIQVASYVSILSKKYKLLFIFKLNWFPSNWPVIYFNEE